MTVKANEALSFDGLTITPSSDFTLTSTTLSRTDATTITPAPVGTYIKRYFSFSSTTPSFSGTIRFSYSGADLNGIAESDLRLNIRTNGTLWTSQTDVPNTTNDYVESASISSTLNTLTLASVARALPVTWLSFTAEKQGTASLLKWSTASEQNTKDFEVQHSPDAINWTSIGTVLAAGNSSTVRNYSFTHQNPIKGGIRNYYRILQHDLNGQNSYSRIQSLVFDESNTAIQVYPNPARNILNIYLAESQTLQLIDMSGTIVWTGNLPAGNNQLSIAHLAKGPYIIKGKTNQYRVVVQ